MVSFGNRLLAALVTLYLQLWTLHAEDKVPYTEWGNAGDGNAEGIEVKVYDGYDMGAMITKVQVGYILDASEQQSLLCVGFTYGPKDTNPCNAETYPGSTVETIELDMNEYIISVSGCDMFMISKISMKTNTGREIGPYGSKTLPDTFEASNGGAPLLHSVMKQSSVFLMEISFTFLEYQVHALKETCNTVANEVYGNIKGSITSLYDTEESYRRKLYHTARMGCEIEDPDHPENNVDACNLQSILQQVDIMIQNSLSHQTHTTTNLVPYSEYDSEVLLSELNNAKAFHSLLTSMEFGAQMIINVTEEQSNQLKQYYQAQAEFNRQIAEKDVAYLNGTLIRTKDGAAKAADVVTDSLTRIIDRCIAVIKEEEAEASLSIIKEMSRMFNPFAEIFGGPDIDNLMSAVEDFANAVADMEKVQVLQDTIVEYSNLQAKIAESFAKNDKQIEGMKEIVDKFDKIHDQKELEQVAKDFIESYGDYTPAVTPEDIDYMSALLNEIGAEGCDIISSSEGIIVSVDKALFTQATADCVHFPADQAKLDSYYQETYSIQFDMVDALTEVSRASFSEAMAEQIGSIHTTIDVQKAAIETLMLEVQVQTIAGVRCNRLQYVSGGQRSEVCKYTLFSDTQINGIIAYRPSLSFSDVNRYAYYPTSLQNSAQEPFIDIEKLLRGQSQTIRLPFNNTEWLKKYQWLPGQYNDETGFYYENLEAYLPGVKCNETAKDLVKVYVKLNNRQSQKLYKQVVEPTFSIPTETVQFNYETDTSSCAGQHETFRIMKNDTEAFGKPDKEVTICVTSKGDVPIFDRDDNTLPSLFSSWNLEVFSDEDCTLILDPDFDFYPLVTFKMVIKEVYLKSSPSDPGLDECWPEGSRCPEGLYCHDDFMDFSCQETKQVTDEEQGNAVGNDVADDARRQKLIKLLTHKYRQ